MGSDGGLPQYFLLEVIGGNPVSPDLSRNDFDNNLNTNEISTMNDQATTAPLRRIKESVPEFKLFDLEPGREYQVNCSYKVYCELILTINRLVFIYSNCHHLVFSICGECKGPKSSADCDARQNF